MLDTTTQVEDHLAVIDAVNGVVIAADARDWAACRRRFADEVFLDHDGDGTSASGVRADDMIAGWQKLFSNFATTFHAVTNHQVELVDQRATCRSYVHALHVANVATAGENYHTTYGFYTDQLARIEGEWRITSRVYRELYEQGNPTIFRQP